MMKNLIKSALYTDLYQIAMGQAYFDEGRHNEEAVFDYFFRKVPFKGGYVVFAGLEDLLDQLEDFRFDEGDLDYLKSYGFSDDYLKELGEFRFKGSIDSAAEGDLVFPTRPVLSVKGGLLETQLVESALLNILNFQSLVATKAARIRHSAGNRLLSDFGMRRAQGLGAVHASRAAVIGGFNSTSNVYSAKGFDLKASGTMAHSFIQSFDSELEAFRCFAKSRPDHTVLLIDTYDTLRSGLPNALKVAREMKEDGKQLLGVRLDSGDLAYFARKCRERLDEEGLHDVKIVASNQLDEYVIKSVLDQGAPIDVFGVGTSLATAQPDAALDGVYKLAMAGGKPRLKISENLEKVTLPNEKQVLRYYDDKGKFFGADAVVLKDEDAIEEMHHPFHSDKSMAVKDMRSEALLKPVMKNGKRLIEKRTVSEIADFAQQRLSLLPAEYKRFDNPHIYKVGLSTRLRDLRNQLKKEHLNLV